HEEEAVPRRRPRPLDEARAGEIPVSGLGTGEGAVEREERHARAAASCPHAASMSRPRVRRTVAGRPCSCSVRRKAAIAFRDEPSNLPVGLYGIRFTLKKRGFSSFASSCACSKRSFTPASITYSTKTLRRRRAKYFVH